MPGFVLAWRRSRTSVEIAPKHADPPRVRRREEGRAWASRFSAGRSPPRRRARRPVVVAGEALSGSRRRSTRCGSNTSGYPPCDRPEAALATSAREERGCARNTEVVRARPVGDPERCQAPEPIRHPGGMRGGHPRPQRRADRDARRVRVTRPRLRRVVSRRRPRDRNARDASPRALRLRSKSPRGRARSRRRLPAEGARSSRRSWSLPRRTGSATSQVDRKHAARTSRAWARPRAASRQRESGSREDGNNRRDRRLFSRHDVGAIAPGRRAHPRTPSTTCRAVRVADTTETRAPVWVTTRT